MEIGEIDRTHEPACRECELEHYEPTARAENAAELTQRLVEVGDVAQTERDRGAGEARVRKGQRERVGGETGGRPPAPPLEITGRQGAHGDPKVPGRKSPPPPPGSWRPSTR